jgi:septum formation protein
LCSFLYSHIVRFILASASLQRRQLLESIGLSFVVIPSSISEAACAIADPVERAVCLARRKAENVHAKHPDAFVLGCDTLVVAPDGTLLEKPRDAADADRMLRLQSGATSVVHSAVCLCTPAGNAHEDLSSSRVRFKALSDADRAWWIATGQWKDRSGAFQIDGLGQLMIEHLEGDWTGVVGLPVYVLGRLMQEAGMGFVPSQ